LNVPFVFAGFSDPEWFQTYFEIPRSMGNNESASRYTTKNAEKNIAIICEVTEMAATTALMTGNMANLLSEAVLIDSILYPFQRKPTKIVANISSCICF
jgi:hypothetical protein